MTYPTWDKIKEKFGITDNTRPESKFGNIAFKYEERKCRWGTKVVGQFGNNNPVGIDVPVLLEPAQEQENIKNRTIIILGESPLRNSKDTIQGCNVVFGTPYAVHQKMGAPVQCDVYKLIFDGLLKEGYSVYITDIIKVWWKDKKLNPSKEDYDCLKDELKLFKNPFVIAWGNKAQSALSALGSLPHLAIPHPSKQNWQHWKLRIFMKAVFCNNLSYAKNIYKSKEDPTTADIVAKEALKEIMDGIA